MLHNRYLPGWVHRLVNGVFGGCLSLMALVGVVRFLGVPMGVLWCAMLVAIGVMAVDPRRFSLVEGCAGDLGYDELMDGEGGGADDGGETRDG